MRQILRKQTLFYTEVVNILKNIYPPKDYTYRDDFYGELFMYRESDHLLVVEIKSEKEVQAVSTMTSGKFFKKLRGHIHKLKCLNSFGDGKFKGWLSIIAQCWDYMKTGLPEDIDKNSFTIIEDILAIPYDKKYEVHVTIEKILNSNCSVSDPIAKIIDYPKENVSILICKHSQLDKFINGILSLDTE